MNGQNFTLAIHDVTLCAVSRAPLAKLQAYKQRMGWSFPWASSFDSDFNYDFQTWNDRNCRVSYWRTYFRLSWTMTGGPGHLARPSLTPVLQSPG
jgi:predicted dithiol-disulfide oxidoreductase (DUF899 family)